ncbi:hypothetical protein PAECIP111891_02435 [Paenibacillus allorhizoplanae]|uniref:Uncharacterized protein n=1 Tax=Paenibacillus allorhizoplanae TaxID=2905648 RepID=A0ABN8GEH9_9BACL|nr:hypothetical protein PAECIP111891_02435 [Paenibacillus allorhizoplanae]
MADFFMLFRKLIQFINDNNRISNIDTFHQLFNNEAVRSRSE